MTNSEKHEENNTSETSMRQEKVFSDPTPDRRLKARIIANNLYIGEHLSSDHVENSVSELQSLLENDVPGGRKDQEDFFDVYLSEEGGAIPTIREAVKELCQRSIIDSGPGSRASDLMKVVNDLKKSAIRKMRMSSSEDAGNRDTPEEVQNVIERLIENKKNNAESLERQNVVNSDFIDWATGKKDFEGGFTDFDDKRKFLDEMEDIWEHAQESEEPTLEIIKSSFSNLMNTMESLNSMREEWVEAMGPIGDMNESFIKNKDKKISVETLFREFDLNEEEKGKVIDWVRNR